MESRRKVWRECEGLDKMVLLDLIPKVLQWETLNIISWLLSGERTGDQRVRIGDFIHNIYLERERLIDEMH